MMVMPWLHIHHCGSVVMVTARYKFGHCMSVRLVVDKFFSLVVIV